MPTDSKKKLKSFKSFVQKKTQKEYRKIDQSGSDFDLNDSQDTTFDADTSVDLIDPRFDIDGSDEDVEPDDFHVKLMQVQEQQKQREMEEQRLLLESKTVIRELQIKTASYCLAYAALGLALGSLGATEAPLAHNTNVEEDVVAGNVVTARGLGWIAGSVVAGKLYETFPGHRILYFSLFLTSIFMFVIPLIPEIWSLCTIVAVSAAFMSWIEVGVNTMALWLWKEKVGPYIQLLHFAFGAGLMASPFMHGVIVKIFPEYFQTTIYYWILSVLIGIIGVWPLKLKSPKIEKDYSESHAHGMSHGVNFEQKQKKIEENVTVFYAEEIAWEKSRREKIQKARFYIIVPLIVSYLFLYGGVENCIGLSLVTYSTKIYNMDESESSFLDSVFWGSLTIGRLLSVPLASRVSSRILLLIDMLACILAFTILILFEHFEFKALLWICTVVIGGGMASIFATAFTIPTELRLQASSKASSAFVVASGIGDMILPIFAGYGIGILGPQFLLWLSLVVFLLCFAIYIVVYTFGLSTMEKRLEENELTEIENLNDYWGE